MFWLRSIVGAALLCGTTGWNLAAASEEAKDFSGQDRQNHGVRGKNPEGANFEDTGPRLGKYNIHSYGAVGSPPLFLGHVELMAGGKYRASRKSSGDYYGEGKYAYDAESKTVTWLSGPYKEDKWGGAFTIEREGKTHKIRLRRSTIATNSLD